MVEHTEFQQRIKTLKTKKKINNYKKISGKHKGWGIFEQKIYIIYCDSIIEKSWYIRYQCEQGHINSNSIHIKL